MRLLKIESLEPIAKTWHDRDVIILHACFQILKDFVEKEKGDKHCDYEYHKEFVDEVRFLYNWWLERSTKLEFDNQDEEDNEMLLRLMKIRLSLWT
jgi:hypothetical protein